MALRAHVDLFIPCCGRRGRGRNAPRSAGGRQTCRCAGGVGAFRAADVGGRAGDGDARARVACARRHAFASPRGSVRARRRERSARRFARTMRRLDRPARRPGRSARWRNPPARRFEEILRRSTRIAWRRRRVASNRLARNRCRPSRRPRARGDPRMVHDMADARRRTPWKRSVHRTRLACGLSASGLFVCEPFTSGLFTGKPFAGRLARRARSVVSTAVDLRASGAQDARCTRRARFARRPRHVQFPRRLDRAPLLAEPPCTGAPWRRGITASLRTAMGTWTMARARARARTRARTRTGREARTSAREGIRSHAPASLPVRRHRGEDPCRWIERERVRRP